MSLSHLQEVRLMFEGSRWGLLRFKAAVVMGESRTSWGMNAVDPTIIGSGCLYV